MLSPEVEETKGTVLNVECWEGEEEEAVTRNQDFTTANMNVRSAL